MRTALSFAFHLILFSLSVFTLNTVDAEPVLMLLVELINCDSGPRNKTLHLKNEALSCTCCARP